MTGFIVIPDEFHKLNLTPNEKLILALVFSYSQKEQGCYYGSLAETAERFGISKRSVQGCLQALQEKKLIAKKSLTVDGVARCGYTCSKNCHIANFAIANFATNNIDKDIHTSNAHAREKFDFKEYFMERGATEQTMRDWLQVRKEKKGVNTQAAAEKIMEQIRISGRTVEECLRHAAASSWCGFKWAWWKKEIEEENNDNQPRNENRRNNDKRRGTDVSHPSSDEDWGFGDRQRKTVLPDSRDDGR